MYITICLDEEAKLCEHLKDLASFGYGYTRAEGVNLASGYAISLGKVISHSLLIDFISL
jgi:hypothetical protein